MDYRLKQIAVALICGIIVSAVTYMMVPIKKWPYNIHLEDPYICQDGYFSIIGPSQMSGKIMIGTSTLVIDNNGNPIPCTEKGD